MLYSEKLELFEKEHPCQFVTVDGARFRYILCGREGGKTLVLLNGGMNTLEMWLVCSPGTGRWCWRRQIICGPMPLTVCWYPSCSA